MEALRIIFKNRRLLFSAVLHDLRAKFSGNVFGLVWLILYPLLFLLMYSVVFAHILKVRMPGLGTTDYVLLIFCGLVPFLAFAESFGVGTLSLVSNRNLIRNTLFPVELVVAKDVLVGHASMGVGMALVWVACLYFGHVYLTQFFVLVVFVLQIVFSLGVMWITSTLTVFFRDLQQGTPILVLFMMLVSPIAYTESMVPDGLRPLLDFNPLARLITLYRSILLTGNIPWHELVLFSIIAFFVFFVGFSFISRLKSMFVDYV